MGAPIITVFGGTGFIGRIFVQTIARTGARVRVVTSDTENALFVRMYGNVGQVSPIYVNTRSQEQISAVCKGASAVVNFIGALYPSHRNSFEHLHVDVPSMIGKACAQHTVKRLLHMSAIGANSQSASRYGRTKGQGELEIRKQFPQATIIRPSLVFGPGDRFFNRFAEIVSFVPILGMFYKGATRFQPVYVGDVIEAMCGILNDHQTQGKTYELGGPDVYTFKQLLEIMGDVMGRKIYLLNLSRMMGPILSLSRYILNEPLITGDQLILLTQDNIVAKGAYSFGDLNLHPQSVLQVLPTYLKGFPTHF